MITFDHVYNVFGPNPRDALARLDRGEARDDILESTGNLIATQDVSLEVKKGEILVLMGLSGSGKSTLLRCANALVRPVRGRVLFRTQEGEVDLGTTDENRLRRIRQHGVSMVFQKFALLPWRTLRGNVAFGLEVRGVSWDESQKIVDEMLDKVGLGGWKDKYPHELSGGMQQRVGLARALATNADLLLLDEPFSALDPLIRTKMQDELLVLQRELKRTMIFVTHDLDEALKLGSRVAIMEAGRLIQIGTPEDIVTRPSTEYVKRFVSHVNPLNVLRGSTLMRSLDELVRDPADAGVVLLDTEGRSRCRLDREGRPVESWIGTAKGTILPYHAKLGKDDVKEGDLVSSPADTPMRAAIEVNHATGLPLLLLDASGKLVGIVGGREILKCLSRTSNAAE